MSDLLWDVLLYLFEPLVDAIAWTVRLVLRIAMALVWCVMALVRAILGGDKSQGRP